MRGRSAESDGVRVSTSLATSLLGELTTGRNEPDALLTARKSPLLGPATRAALGPAARDRHDWQAASDTWPLRLAFIDEADLASADALPR